MPDRSSIERFACPACQAGPRPEAPGRHTQTEIQLAWLPTNQARFGVAWANVGVNGITMSKQVKMRVRPEFRFAPFLYQLLTLTKR